PCGPAYKTSSTVCPDRADTSSEEIRFRIPVPYRVRYTGSPSDPKSIVNGLPVSAVAVCSPPAPIRVTTAEPNNAGAMLAHCDGAEADCPAAFVSVNATVPVRIPEGTMKLI